MEDINSKDAPIDTYTNKLIDLAIEIAQAGKQYFFEGGFAIDFYLGKVTRNHHDLDFHPLVEDIDWWLEWFKKRGFTPKKLNKDGWDDVYKIENEDEEEILDMWPLKTVGDKLQIKHYGEYIDTEKFTPRFWSETKIVKFRGIDIRIDDPKQVIIKKQRFVSEGKPMRPQDLHDMEIVKRIK